MDAFSCYFPGNPHPALNKVFILFNNVYFGKGVSP